MSALGTLLSAGRLVGAVDVTVDSEGIVTDSPFLPAVDEIIYGGIASLIIFVLLFKFAGPSISKAFAARTLKIQNQLDSAAADKASAASQSASIRQAKGDIDAERTRLLADADAQAETMIADVRVRIEEEILELHARAASDIATARSRGSDELRAEIARLSSSAADRAVLESIDEATQQELIEDFIQTVGLRPGGVDRQGASA